MKKLFAKYLLGDDDGEIQVSDICKNRLNEIGKVTKIKNLIWGFTHELKVIQDSPFSQEGELIEERKENLTKLGKLFMCSRDIKAGDKDVYFGITKLDDALSDDECDYLKTMNAFKVVGTISSDAKWIKEGDEFEFLKDCWISNSEIGQLNAFKVKGPCGCFH